MQILKEHSLLSLFKHYMHYINISYDLIFFMLSESNSNIKKRHMFNFK